MDTPARRSITIEYATLEALKVTMIESVDATTGAVGTSGSMIEGMILNSFGHAVSFHVAAVVNVLTCVQPLVTK